MPTSLTTIAAGAAIDADVLRLKLRQIETYVNEEVAATDRGSSWCTANHIYRPDFYGSPNSHTTMVSGENYFRSRDTDPATAAYFSFYMGEGPFLIPGMSATIQVPESLEQGSVYYRLNVFASFYAYEYGGDDGNIDESTYLAATFHLGTTARPTDIRDRTLRTLYKSSDTDTLEEPMIYPRKQHSLMWAFAGNGLGVTTPGVVSLGVWVKPFRPATVSPPYWKHIIIQQANMIARYRIR